MAVATRLVLEDMLVSLELFEMVVSYFGLGSANVVWYI